ncbi:acyltransferase family protein [Nocardioides sp. GCM10027113]|uniref:acyltransferase family protein n=1 Tax=unclassified Nocardioides TaxID=2615069 RepID=UPI00360686BB
MRTTHQTDAPRRSNTRDPWFDNAKMALVTLVVVGHAWVLLPSTGLSDTLYDFLYAWHVPAFVFVTGYLSRSFEWDRMRLWKLVRTVAVPYVIFESLLALFRIHVGGEELEELFLDPHWPMWYLSALFFWRLMTPLFRGMPWGLPVAVGISLAAGLWAGDTFDVARILGLLPFFVAGLKARPEHLERLRDARWRPYAVAVLATILVLSLWTDTWAATEWLYYRAMYDELPGGDLRAFATRSAVLLMGALGAAAFLSLVPRRGGWFTRMGTWTLVVYLFHGFPVKGAAYAGYEAIGAWGAVVGILVTTLLAVGLALLLAWEPLASRLNLVVDPIGPVERRLRARRERARAADGAGDQAGERERETAGAGPGRR